MNKELINKYWNEFVHWKGGGSILVKYANPRDAEEGYEDWHEDDEVWNSNLPCLIIINDEYSHFRKALAEGKTVQFKPSLRALDLGYDFVDISRDISDYDIRLLRIKPEGPKFKVGDWVTTKDKEIGRIISINYRKLNYYRVSNTHAEKCEVGISADTLTLWQPKPSEWCWSPVFGLVKVICEATENGNPCYVCWNPWKKAEQKLNNLEPFIGELPSHLKD